MDVAADRGVLPLGVLAIDEHVNRAGRLVAQGRLHPLEQISRPQVDVLLEAPPHRQQQLADAQVVRHVRAAHRAEQNGVELLELLEAVSGHHPAVLLVIAAAPGEARPAQAGLVAPHRRVGHADGLFDHLRADAVAADHRHLESCHCTTFPFFVKPRPAACR